MAILGRDKSDFELIEKVVRHYDLAQGGGLTTHFEVERLWHEVTLPSVDALIFITTPSAPLLKRLLEVSEKILGSDLQLVSLQGVDALLRDSPGLTESTLQPGSLRGRPQLPKEEVKTFSTTSRLVASVDLDRSTVARLAEQLFQRRQWIAQTNPEANFVQAPADEKAMTARLPNHRGALDYFNREQQTFMDQYGDWLWLTLFAAGGASSLAGWVVQSLARRQREAIDSVLGRLLKILDAARSSSSLDELSKLRLETDQLVAKAVHQARKHATSTTAMNAVKLAIDAAHHAIDDRHRELLHETDSRKGTVLRS